MSRAPFQVILFPFIRQGNDILFSVFRRSDDNSWQAISGGGEDAETPMEAAKREGNEEAGISKDLDYIKLDTINSIPVTCFQDYGLWSKKLYVIPEYSFGVEIKSLILPISNEHKEYKWCSYQEVRNLLKWDSNKTALWELNQKIRNKGPREN